MKILMILAFLIAAIPALASDDQKSVGDLKIIKNKNAIIEVIESPHFYREN